LTAAAVLNTCRTSAVVRSLIEMRSFNVQLFMERALPLPNSSRLSLRSHIVSVRVSRSHVSSRPL
jgi:hypothetical protein